jgi:hypothetical protein
VTLSDILRRNRDDIALVIGNGVHRHGPPQVNSWEDLLTDLAHQSGVDQDGVPHGASATEFFDILELRAQTRSGVLAEAFCELMRDWRPLGHHRRIMQWAAQRGVPVLTTNFDEVLSAAAEAELMRPGGGGFTDFYPWDSRFAHSLHEDPCDGFGIWHINGMARYARSIRLGLTHYMGSVQRARGWLHRGEERLFNRKDRWNWAGRRTWMHLVFNKPLLIFGLGLRENEVFLRWLLIERARYFAKFEDRRHPAWYVYRHDAGDPTQAGRHFFLDSVGVRCVRVSDHREIYENEAWRD